MKPKPIQYAADGKAHLKEPYWKQQEGETDQEYKLFLVYRDIQWDERTLIQATAVATNAHPNLVKNIHPAVMSASSKWRWSKRAVAYDLYIQENSSERQEQILLKAKSDMEHITMKIVQRLRRIERIADLNNITDEERRDMAIVKGLCGDKPAYWMMEAYRTLFGNKVKVLNPGQSAAPIGELEWKEVA